jgi:hypothetical protein
VGKLGVRTSNTGADLRGSVTSSLGWTALSASNYYYSVEIFSSDQREGGGGELQDWIPIIVAAIAATAALIGYFVNSSISRRSELIRHYADALAEVEKYRQLPFTFHRLHDSTRETRKELAKMMGENQAALAFYRRSLQLGSPAVGMAYARLVDKIREKNSIYREEALSSPPVCNDIDIEIGRPYNYDVKDELDECVTLMRRELRLFKWSRK